MAEIPSDPVILLSYLNTQLRDFYEDIQDLCKSLNLSEEEIRNRLKAIDYEYDADVKFPVNLWKSQDWEMVEEGEEQTYFSLCYTPEIFVRKQV